MSEKLDECYEFVVKLAKEGGQLVRERIWSQKTVDCKSCDIDLVTETDRQVEELIISNLKSKFPDHRFIGEESTATGIKCEFTDDPTWIIDPVDGTLNFVHGYPNVCVSVALWVNKVAEIGIIYNPVLELFFSARRGQGAFLNGKPIHVSCVNELSKSLIGFEFGASRDAERLKIVVENLNILMPHVHGMRSSGSCAQNMAMVALGGTDANFEFGVHAWDMAAGCLIVIEAGGVVIDPAGGPFDVLSRRYLCAGTQELADQLVKVIKHMYPERD